MTTGPMRSQTLPRHSQHIVYIIFLKKLYFAYVFKIRITLDCFCWYGILFYVNWVNYNDSKAFYTDLMYAKTGTKSMRRCSVTWRPYALVLTFSLHTYTVRRSAENAVQCRSWRKPQLSEHEFFNGLYILQSASPFLVTEMTWTSRKQSRPFA